MAVYAALISLPWSLKLFYGLITDNVKIFGLRRKPYLIFFGFLQFVVMVVLFYKELDNALEVTLYLMIASFSMAFSNVVVDAILVIQARKDPYLGSQDLLSIAWLF
jgi:MFS-type transporter involved in bile tolerance (Atg22 family)